MLKVEMYIPDKSNAFYKEVIQKFKKIHNLPYNNLKAILTSITEKIWKHCNNSERLLILHQIHKNDTTGIVQAQDTHLSRSSGSSFTVIIVYNDLMQFQR
jgi:hypothetical protein